MHHYSKNCDNDVYSYVWGTILFLYCNVVETIKDAPRWFKNVDNMYRRISLIRPQIFRRNQRLTVPRRREYNTGNENAVPAHWIHCPYLLIRSKHPRYPVHGLLTFPQINGVLLYCRRVKKLTRLKKCSSSRIKTRDIEKKLRLTTRRCRYEAAVGQVKCYAPR